MAGRTCPCLVAKGVLVMGLFVTHLWRNALALAADNVGNEGVGWELGVAAHDGAGGDGAWGRSLRDGIAAVTRPSVSTTPPALSDYIYIYTYTYIYNII